MATSTEKRSVVSLIGYTLARAHRLYSPLDRGLREGAFQFFFMAVVFSVLITALVCYAAWYLGLYPTDYGGDPERFIYFVAAFHGLKVCSGYVVLCISQFAIVMRMDSVDHTNSTSFRRVVSALNNNHLSNFFIAVLALFLVHLVLFSSLMDIDPSFTGVFGSWRFNTEDNPTVLDQYAVWAMGLADEVMQYAPYIVSVYLLMVSAKGEKAMTIRTALPALGATLIIAFCIGSLYSGIIALMQEVIFPIFTIPFQGSFFPVVFGLVLTALIGGYFLPLVSLCLYEPLDLLTGSGDSSNIMDRWTES